MIGTDASVDPRESEPPANKVVRLVSDPINRTLSVSIQEHSKWGLTPPSKVTQEFATQVLAAIHRSFPAAEVTPYKMRGGSF